MTILEKIKALNLPAHQFVVMGSAILEMKGIRKAGDLDIIVTQELFEELKGSPDWKYQVEWGEVGGGMDVESLENHKGVSLYKYIYGGGEIGFFLNDPKRIEEIDGIYFVSLENLLQTKSSSWDRPKDREDAELIKNYLNSLVSTEPEYWKNNLQFVYPKGLFEVQYKFAQIMAERQNIPLIDAIEKYAPLLNKAIRSEDNKELLPNLTDENILDVGYATVLERRKNYTREGLSYHDENESRFGCFCYRYDEDTKTISPHFFNAEAEDEWENGVLISKGPLSKEKIERRMSELRDMFSDIRTKYPDAQYVKGRSSLYNIEAYRRLFPPTYTVSSDVDYDLALWAGNTDIWGQFLGGDKKQKGEYGFKKELADEFLEKVKEVPLDRLADALPMPPRNASGNIEDFYSFYGIKEVL